MCAHCCALGFHELTEDRERRKILLVGHVRMIRGKARPPHRGSFPTWARAPEQARLRNQILPLQQPRHRRQTPAGGAQAVAGPGHRHGQDGEAGRRLSGPACDAGIGWPVRAASRRVVAGVPPACV
jgi:hypothetical protein